MAAPVWQPGTLYLPGDLVQPITQPAPNNPQVINGCSDLLVEVFGDAGRHTRSAVGFVLARVVVDEAEILTIAVAPSHRRRGVGCALVEELCRRLYRDRVASLFLEVDAGNTAAVTLYRRLRFEKVGERRGYYAHGSVPGATALVMRADIR